MLQLFIYQDQPLKIGDAIICVSSPKEGVFKIFIEAPQSVRISREKFFTSEDRETASKVKDAVRLHRTNRQQKWDRRHGAVT